MTADIPSVRRLCDCGASSGTVSPVGEAEGFGQLDGSTDGTRRHQGQLHNRSFLTHHGPFKTADLAAGTTFEADLRKLLTAVQRWEECVDSFDKTVDGMPLAASVPDGTGPVAHALGARFNHRVSADAGVGYAALAYARRLAQLRAGLTQTLDNLARAEQNATGGFTGGAVAP